MLTFSSLHHTRGLALVHGAHLWYMLPRIPSWRVALGKGCPSDCPACCSAQRGPAWMGLRVQQ